jgi:hypothetical protein
MKKKLLIIVKEQFGYHTDSYKYCQYLKNEFEITYICFDVGEEKILEENINILYCPYSGSFLQRGIEFIQFCRNFIKHNEPDLIFTVYFQMVSLLRISLPFHKFILDIRTGSINKNIKKRKKYDRIMKYESLFFQNITIISKCLSEKLNIPNKKSHILPLGSDILSYTDKNFDAMHLLYVGTLDSRDIHETIEGLSIFLETCEYDINDISYDIFGSGTIESETILKQMIIDKKLEKIVLFHGRKNHKELKQYFNRSNIGISYIPITDYFDCQPPTKTYEYINAGLVCLATATKENITLINSDNGTLCKSNPHSFAEGLMKIFKERKKYNSKNIRDSLKESTWDNIIKQNLLYYLKEKVK